jgi:pyruvate/2-oxoglutarate dehydrogenase complex dihydrolipoamide dehydrogenase (E3) component
MKDGGGASLLVEPVKGGAQETLDADVILSATGRIPFTQGLGLEVIHNRKLKPSDSTERPVFLNHG